MSTPEAKIKKMVRELLAEFAVYGIGMNVPVLKQYWPVPSGFGASDLDCIVCYYGYYIAIETKAPGKLPTPRQKLAIAETKGARGMAFVIDGDIGLHELRVVLQRIKDANDRKS